MAAAAVTSSRASGMPRDAGASGHVRFPRMARLTKTDEYSSVFGFRQALRGQFFMLHYGSPHPGQGARLGTVVGKKFLKRAVGRNFVKRILRERFRHARTALPCCDLLFRLFVRLEKPDRSLRRALREDIDGLLRRIVARRSRVEAPAAAKHGDAPC